MTCESLIGLGAHIAGRIEDEPDSLQPVEHITRLRTHPRKTVRPSPVTFPPSTPSLARAQVAHLQLLALWHLWLRQRAR